MRATSEVTYAGSLAEGRSGRRQASEGARRTYVGALTRRAEQVMRQESLLVALLAGSFLARWLLADRSSYWFDELLSVSVYGQWHDNVFEALRDLASNSIHPPLYQFILYYWMEIFGDSERATRSLSNLYITLGTLFIYLLLRNIFSQRVALASALVFALMYTPMYYALETRSYAQTLFLVTVSSYLLVRMMRTGAQHGWRSVVVSPTSVTFVGINAALLLTHYYNAFFWVAQGLIVGAFMLRELRLRQWPTGLAAVFALYGLQGAIFAVAWGRVLLGDVRRRGGAFPVEDAVRSPVELLQSVLAMNIDAPRLVRLAGLAVVGALVIGAVLALSKGEPLTLDRQQAWLFLYLVGWLLVPLLVIYVAFEITGVARYSPRYWLFIVPAVAPLLVLIVREVVRVASRVLRHGQGIGTSPLWPAAAMLTAITTMILPGTLNAATAEKYNWRGIVQQVVDVVEADSESSYIIYEAGWRSRPLTTYYFERFSSNIEPYGTLQGSEERVGEFRILTLDEPVITRHDYLVVVFPHMRVGQFPRAVAELSERYEVRHWQISRSRHGYIIFDVNPD
jgi:uncharacterized membrane protein